jgi:hypothetical protein
MNRVINYKGSAYLEEQLKGEYVAVKPTDTDGRLLIYL